MQNATSVPPDNSVTELPAYWKESVSDVADGPLPFSSLEIGKLKAPAVRSTDTDADALRCRPTLHGTARRHPSPSTRKHSKTGI